MRPEDKEDDYIVLDKVSGNHKKADVYSIIKFVSKNSNDIKKIESAVTEIDNALETYKAIIENKVETFKKDNPLLSEDEAYLCEYKEKYDNTKEIRAKAYNIISEILKIQCPHYTFVDVDYTALVYDNFISLYERENYGFLY